MATNFTNRFYLAFKFALKHLFFSCLIASIIAIFVFQLWFPYPYREMAGGRDLFWLIVSVDVVCGPLLSLVLYNPIKSKKELIFDLTIVVVIQIAALIYGLFSLANARPVALVFEVDRFRAVVLADIQTNDIIESKKLNIDIPLVGVRQYGIREANNTDENLQSIELGLQGVEPSMRPQWWIAYEKAIPAVLKKSKAIELLKAKHPQAITEIDAMIQNTGLKETDLVWLPFVSRRNTNWTIILDKKNALPVAYIGLDGF